MQQRNQFLMDLARGKLNRKLELSWANLWSHIVIISVGGQTVVVCSCVFWLFMMFDSVFILYVDKIEIRICWNFHWLFRMNSYNWWFYFFCVNVHSFRHLIHSRIVIFKRIFVAYDFYKSRCWILIWMIHEKLIYLNCLNFHYKFFIHWACVVWIIYHWWNSFHWMISNFIDCVQCSIIFFGKLWSMTWKLIVVFVDEFLSVALFEMSYILFSKLFVKKIWQVGLISINLMSIDQFCFFVLTEIYFFQIYYCLL